MKHKHHWLFFWYHEGCARCKVRQLQYGFRMDPVGYMTERDRIFTDTRFTSYERLYILNHCKPITIEIDL